LQHVLQLFTHLDAGTKQPAAHRAQGQVEHLGDRFVTASVNFAQHEDCAVFFTQVGQCRLYDRGLLLLLQSRVGGRTVVDRLIAPRVARLVDR
jgi:hypothetical protein